MAKKPTVTTVASGYYGRQALNDNFEALRDAFDNTLSRDGSTPNAMGADLDMNSNDILNAQTVNTEALRLDGILVGSADLSAAGATLFSDDYTGDGSTVAYTMSYQPFIKDNTQVYIDGVYQNKAGYSISGTTLTFSEAPPLNANIEIVVARSLTTAATDASNVGYTQGGTGSVNTTVEAKLQETVSVKDFGAVGDGVTDDTAAINAAIAVALANYKMIFIPSGVYVVTSTLTEITEEGITIFGESRDVTGVTTGSVLKRTGSDTLTMLKFSGACRRSTVKNITFDANSIASTCIEIDGPKVTIDNCTTTGATSSGIYVTSFSTLIKECDVVFNDGHGVTYATSLCNDSRIVNGSISGNAKHGINVSPLSGYPNGLFFNGINMENNCTAGSAGTPYAHVNIAAGIEQLYISNMYHESDINQTGFASQRFYKLASGNRGLRMDNVYMSCATSREFNYHVEIGSSSYPVKLSNCVGNNWNTAMIDNQSGASGSLILDNVTELNTTSPQQDIVDYAGAAATAGQSLTILPNRATAKMTLSSDQTISSTSLVDVTFDTSADDPTGVMVDTANNGIRVMEEGYYLVNVNLSVYNGSASEVVKSDIVVGGSAAGDHRFAAPIATVVQSGNIVALVKADANDLIKVRCAKSTNNFDIYASNNYTHFSVVKVASSQN